MRLRLISRVEQADNDKLQLVFIQVAPAEGATAAGVQLTGWFDRTEAMTYEVGREYDLALTAV